MAIKLFDRKIKQTNGGLVPAQGAELAVPSKINVLLMGASGVGKSTLINAIIPGANAPTGAGRAVTTVMTPYSAEDLPLTLIDSVGYEFSRARQSALRKQILRWSNTGARKKDASRIIHMIWFCIDAPSRRVFDEVLGSLRNVTKVWKDIPIIIVFTKSYGTDEDDAANVKMFQDVLAGYKHAKELNIKERDIIPVVAREYETVAGTVPIKGLDRLVERTRELIPEAQRNAEAAIHGIELKLKRSEATALIATSTATAATIGAVPIAFPDATLLVPLQTYMLTRIEKIYALTDKHASKQITDAAIKAGVTTIAGRSLLNAVKAIPAAGQLAGSILNAAVAGLVTAVVGEASAIIFENTYTGKLVLSADNDYERLILDIIKDKLPNILNTFSKDGSGLSAADLKTLPKLLANTIKDILRKDQ